LPGGRALRPDRDQIVLVPLRWGRGPRRRRRRHCRTVVRGSGSARHVQRLAGDAAPARGRHHLHRPPDQLRDRGNGDHPARRLSTELMAETRYRMDDDFAGTDEDPAAQIPRLETEIERLARVAESCRKIILAGKVAIGIGALVLLTAVTGVIRVDQLVPLPAIAAVLGGIVAAGSNSRPLHEATANMRAAEAQRARLIGALPFSAVIDETR